jgi:filamentous hemagglutinin
MAGSDSMLVPVAREAKVAKLVGGTVSRQKVLVKGLSSTDVDVVGPAGELIGVGGPAKAGDLAKFGRPPQIHKKVPEERGVSAKMYLEEGTPQSAIDLAKRWLGEGNVIVFPK